MPPSGSRRATWRTRAERPQGPRRARRPRALDQRDGRGARTLPKGLEQQFLLSVSHDLRTPLTSIRGYAEAIADGTTPPTRQPRQVILAESRRLERLVRDLLDLAKLEAGSSPSISGRSISATSPTATVEGFRPDAEASRPRAHRRRQHRATSCRPTPIGSRRSSANLVENTLKFARSSGWSPGLRRSGSGALHRRRRRRAGHRDRGPAARVRAPVRQRGLEPVRKETGSGSAWPSCTSSSWRWAATVAAQRAPERRRPHARAITDCLTPTPVRAGRD